MVSTHGGEEARQRSSERGDAKVGRLDFRLSSAELSTLESPVGREEYASEIDDCADGFQLRGPLFVLWVVLSAAPKDDHGDQACDRIDGPEGRLIMPEQQK